MFQMNAQEKNMEKENIDRSMKPTPEAIRGDLRGR